MRQKYIVASKTMSMKNAKVRKFNDNVKENNNSLDLKSDAKHKRYACNLCDKSFAQSTFLTVHLRSHTDERPFDCKICGKSFHQRSHLRYHHLTHSAIRKYKCFICGKELRFKQSLKLHLRVHNEEKSYECDVCGKSFYEKPKLRIHRRIHTGEKPYVCTKCGRAFAQKGNCKKHDERYHARDVERKFPCKLCSKSFIWKKCLKMHLKLHKLEIKSATDSSPASDTNQQSRSTRNKTRLTLLKKNMSKFLPVLIESEMLSEIGWPNISIEEAVSIVLTWCEKKPLKRKTSLNQNETFEGNVKLLIDLVLAEKFTGVSGMTNKSPNEVISALLELKDI